MYDLEWARLITWWCNLLRRLKTMLILGFEIVQASNGNCTSPWIASLRRVALARETLVCIHVTEA